MACPHGCAMAFCWHSLQSSPLSSLLGGVLFHDNCIDGNPLGAVFNDYPRFSPGLDRLGQHPLFTFLTDAIAPTGQSARMRRI